MILKKEVSSSTSTTSELEVGDLTGYRQALVKTLHACSVRYASVAPSVVPLVSNLIYFSGVISFSCLNF